MQILVGNDLVFIPRISRSLESEHFIKRIFSEQEIIDCQKKAKPSPSFAARFAAKEAFSKALGTGLLSPGGFAPKDVWVESLEGGKPVLKFAPAVQRLLAEKKVCSIDLSLSHHEDYALATVSMLVSSDPL